MFIGNFLSKSGNIFFPKLDSQKDQIYFKDIALDFLIEHGFEPELVKSEQQAKEFNIDSKSTKKYPIYFFKTDTSGEKKFEEFYTKDEDYDISTYNSLGFIDSAEIKISFKNVLVDFNHILTI